MIEPGWYDDGVLNTRLLPVIIVSEVVFPGILIFFNVIGRYWFSVSESHPSVVIVSPATIARITCRSLSAA